MLTNYQFLPAPRRVSLSGGTYSLPESALILMTGAGPQALRSAAARFQAALEKTSGLHWQQSASTAVPAADVALTLRVAPERTPVPQGYRLHVQSSGIVVEGHDPAGVFYGVCTLIQLLEQAGRVLPTIEINDWPDIPARGVMLDISRDKVYRTDYLYALVDRLAGWKINQVQLYTEHTFAYRNHPEVWAKASPMTGEEILALDAYCRERFIELVPNQNSFGHMERWLPLPRYYDLAETHDWFTTPWGGHKMKGPFSLAPENPGSIALIASLYDELLPHFTSRNFNVGCDETIDLGQGVSKAACEARGKGQVYFDFLLKIYREVSKRGFTMQFWGDIINNDHPELAAQMPRDVVALNWGYEATHPFDVESERFANSGVPFYVCPGTSTWCSLAGRTTNALGNLLNAAENGIKFGTIGYLNTDWGDRGHWQIPPASYIGFVAGAAYSWALEANRDLDIPSTTSRYAFDDASGVMGRVAYDLGDVYRVPVTQMHNGSLMFWALQTPLAEMSRFGTADNEELGDSLVNAIDAIDAAVAPLGQAQMTRPDAGLITREYTGIARIMRHSLRRTQLALYGDHDGLCASLATDMEGIIEEFQGLWLERARPGGLADSVGRFQSALKDYRA